MHFLGFTVTPYTGLMYTLSVLLLFFLGVLPYDPLKKDQFDSMINTIYSPYGCGFLLSGYIYNLIMIFGESKKIRTYFVPWIIFQTLFIVIIIHLLILIEEKSTKDITVFFIGYIDLILAALLSIFIWTAALHGCIFMKKDKVVTREDEANRFDDNKKQNHFKEDNSQPLNDSIQDSHTNQIQLPSYESCTK